MVSKKKNFSQRGICLSGKIGKGKTTTMNYLYEYCEKHNLPRVRLNFQVNKFSDEVNLLDYISNQIEFTCNKKNIFRKYKKQKESSTKQHKSVVKIAKSYFISSSIGNIGMNFTQNTTSIITQKFFEDFKRIPKETIIFIDHIECLSNDTLSSFVINNFILQKKSDRSFFVFACPNNEELKNEIEASNEIKLFNMPDEYKIDDWITFCDDYCGGTERSKEVVETNYELYKKEPTNMRICLEAHIIKEGEKDVERKQFNSITC